MPWLSVAVTADPTQRVVLRMLPPPSIRTRTRAMPSTHLGDFLVRQLFPAIGPSLEPLRSVPLPGLSTGNVRVEPRPKDLNLFSPCAKNMERTRSFLRVVGSLGSIARDANKRQARTQQPRSRRAELRLPTYATPTFRLCVQNSAHYVDSMLGGHRLHLAAAKQGVQCAVQL